MYRTALTFTFLAACALSLGAQTPAPAAPQRVFATMNQLMRGVLYPAANVVFFAQADNPGEVKQIVDRDPAMGTDPLSAAFGGWQAVENAALALAETASLMSLPGRNCANGVPVPLKDPRWETFVQQVRDASMKAYAGAQAKDQDKMLEVSAELSASCSNCHRAFRDRRVARCTVQ